MGSKFCPTISIIQHSCLMSGNSSRLLQPTYVVVNLVTSCFCLFILQGCDRIKNNDSTGYFYIICRRMEGEL